MSGGLSVAVVSSIHGGETGETAIGETLSTMVLGKSIRLTGRFRPWNLSVRRNFILCGGVELGPAQLDLARSSNSKSSTKVVEHFFEQHPTHEAWSP